MSPGPMLPTEQDREPQQGREVSRLKEHQEDRWAECPRAFAVAVSSSAPSVLSSCSTPQRRAVRTPLVPSSGTVLVARAVCRVTPDLEDILIPIWQAGALRLPRAAAPRDSYWLQSRRRASSGPPVAGKFWADPCPPDREAGGHVGWVGVGASCHLPRYLPGYFLDKWTQARLPG